MLSHPSGLDERDEGGRGQHVLRPPLAEDKDDGADASPSVSRCPLQPSAVGCHNRKQAPGNHEDDRKRAVEFGLSAPARGVFPRCHTSSLSSSSLSSFSLSCTSSFLSVPSVSLAPPLPPFASFSVTPRISSFLSPLSVSLTPPPCAAASSVSSPHISSSPFSPPVPPTFTSFSHCFSPPCTSSSFLCPPFSHPFSTSVPPCSSPTTSLPFPLPPCTSSSSTAPPAPPLPPVSFSASSSSTTSTATPYSPNTTFSPSAPPHTSSFSPPFSIPASPCTPSSFSTSFSTSAPPHFSLPSSPAPPPCSCTSSSRPPPFFTPEPPPPTPFFSSTSFSAPSAPPLPPCTSSSSPCAPPPPSTTTTSSLPPPFSISAPPHFSSPPLHSSSPSFTPPAPPPLSPFSSSPPCSFCSSLLLLLRRLLSSQRREARRLLRISLASLSSSVSSLARRLERLERRERERERERRSRHRKRRRRRGRGGAHSQQGSTPSSPSHLLPVNQEDSASSSSSSSSSDKEEHPSSSPFLITQSGGSRRRWQDKEEDDDGRKGRKRRRTAPSQSEGSVLAISPTLPLPLDFSQSEVGRFLVAGRNGTTTLLIHSPGSQDSLHLLATNQWRFSDLAPSLLSNLGAPSPPAWLRPLPLLGYATLRRLAPVAIETLLLGGLGGTSGRPLPPLRDTTAPPSLQNDHCYYRLRPSSPPPSARRQRKPRANQSARSIRCRRRTLPSLLPGSSTNGVPPAPPRLDGGLSSGRKGQRVSQFRINRATPRETTLFTPLGLPKARRLQKKEFSLEEIYTNKNYKSPTANSLETIFEEPKREKDGSLLLIGQQRRRRLLLFPDFTQPRRRRRPLPTATAQGAWLPVSAAPRKRAASRRRGNSGTLGDDSDEEADLDVMLVERLSALEDFLSRQGLEG